MKIKTIGWLATGASAAILMPALSAAEACGNPEESNKKELKRAKSPNIILIITDEQNASMLGCMGDPYVNTPNIDALAAGGILVNGHYCASPISGPSRQSLTVGKYVSHHNVWGNTVGCPNDVPSIARLMQARGYDAVLAGGMKYGGMNYGFAKYNLQKGVIPAKDRSKREGSDIPKKRTRNIKAGVFPDNGSEVGKEFSPIGATDMSTFTDIERRDNALAFLDSRTDGDNPFFLIVGLIAPHYPLQSTPELIAKYKDRIPMPDIPEGYLENLPLNYKHLRNDRKLENVPDELVKLARESYYAKVEWSDMQVGAVIDAVRSSDFSDNTVIIYTSDHGENLGEHGLWWKNCLYDSSAKVPLIFNCPKRWAGGQRRNEASSAVDLVQTLAHLAGAETPSDWDGESMLPWLDDPACNKWRDIAVCEYYSGYVASGITMLRKGDWKYVYHTRADADHGPQIELYNLKDDPKELVNLAGVAQNAGLIKSLHAQLIEEIGEDPEQTELRYRAGAIPEAPNGILK